MYTFPAPSDKYTPPPPGGRQVCGRRAVIVLTLPSPNLHLTVTKQCIFKLNDLPGAPRGSVLEPRTTDLAPKGPHNLRSKETTTNWGARREWSWQVIDNSTDFRFFASCNQLSLCI